MNIDGIKAVLLSHNSLKHAHSANRYARIVKKFSARQETDTKDTYYEIHHILPASLFPEYSNLTSYPWNAIHLSAREHIVMHHILAKAFGGYMWSAYILMCGRKNAKRNSRFIAAAREEHSKFLSTKNPSTGLTPAQEAGIKSSYTKNKINTDTGLSLAKEAAIRSAATMKTTVVNGETIYERASRKMVQTRKSRGPDYLNSIYEKSTKTKITNGTLLTGDKINTAIKVNIFNDQDKLVKECHGDFFNYLKSIDAPVVQLRDTYLNNTVFKFDFNKKNTLLEKKKFSGWYLRNHGGLFYMYNSRGQVELRNAVATKLIKQLTANRGVYQTLMRTYRTNTVVRIPESALNYLNFESFDGWYARLLNQ